VPVNWKNLGCIVSQDGRQETKHSLLKAGCLVGFGPRTYIVSTPHNSWKSTKMFGYSAASVGTLQLMHEVGKEMQATSLSAKDATNLHLRAARNRPMHVAGTYVHVHVFVCVCASVCPLCTYACIYVYVNIYIYIVIHVCVHGKGISHAHRSGSAGHRKPSQTCTQATFFTK
jgi:hypothetical protein